MAAPPPYDREQMDTIFLDHHDRKFWDLRAPQCLCALSGLCGELSTVCSLFLLGEGLSLRYLRDLLSKLFFPTWNLQLSTRLFGEAKHTPDTRRDHGKHTRDTRKKHTKHTMKSRKHTETHAIFFTPQLSTNH